MTVTRELRGDVERITQDFHVVLSGSEAGDKRLTRRVTTDSGQRIPTY